VPISNLSKDSKMISTVKRDTWQLTKTRSELELRCINTIRILSADAIQKASSGHPGLPMGAAPIGFVLWDKFLKFNPKNPKWFNRDRFILSAGHGSMLYYSLLYLTGYDSITMDDIKNFRQLGTRAPGHPESCKTPGVEVTTGCLGQGLANGVGMALAEAHLAARFNKPDCTLVDHHTYVLAGDGCQMVGLSSEACSLAGHLGLGKLIVLYDENKISIDGSTDLTFTEDVGKRFDAYGWHVQMVEDGDTDLVAIGKAIEKAKEIKDKPSLIRVRTTIGYGSPNLQNTADCHGAALGENEVQASRENLGYREPPFTVAKEVLSYMRKAVERGKAAESGWQKTYSQYKTIYAKEAALFDQLTSERFPDGWEDLLPTYTINDKPKATRVFSGECLNAISHRLTGLIGGSADLSPANKTLIKDEKAIQKGAFHHRNLHFGVREHAMAAICTGMALYGGGYIPYCGTFMVFSDYMRGAIRIAALSHAGVIFIMTHDSVATGEDGPTHQPVEHLSALRAIPNLAVIRPADGTETAGAYRFAVMSRKRPTVLSLTRQSVPYLAETSSDGVLKGAYTVLDCEAAPELIIIGTGSELHICIDAAKQLQADGKAVRVVSMPSQELFEDQDAAYRESVLPASVTRRLVVEAGTSFGWHKYMGSHGASISVDEFGISAPGKVCLEKFGYTVDNVLKEAKTLLG
jgi:transketolase